MVSGMLAAAGDGPDKFSAHARYWVDSDRFNMLMAGVILMNALVIGLETDLGEGNERVFELVNDAFLLVYSSALLTRLFYHGARYFQDGFNNFAATY